MTKELEKIFEDLKNDLKQEFRELRESLERELRKHRREIKICVTFINQSYEEMKTIVGCDHSAIILLIEKLIA